jgi:MFS family permease
MVSAGNRPSPSDSLESTGAPRARKSGGFSNPWRALRHHNFRLFFLGQSVSLIGTWMTRIATSWLVYRLTHSALLLGTVSFSGQIPTFLLAPFAGVWVDRLDRRQVLVWTQVISTIQSFLLAGFTLTGRINIPWIIALSVLQGLINAFDMPARQSFVVQMIDDKADLGNAIAINSSMANTARLIGPSIAGLIIAASSEGWCFLIDGFSYIGVIISLLMMRINVQQIRRKHASTFTDLKEGWEYVSSFLPIRVILSLFALVSLMGIPFVVLMPVFAAGVLQGGAHTLGFLMGAVGLGAVTAALTLAARKSVRGLLRKIPTAAVVFGAGLIGFGFSHTFAFSALAVFVAGWGMMSGMAGSNTVIQTIVSEDKRGRVMSYWAMAFVGMSPFGALLAGTMAHSIPTIHFPFLGGAALSGAQSTVIINGSIVILGALWFFSKRPSLVAVVRPIYQEMGIIPTEEEMAGEQVEST